MNAIVAEKLQSVKLARKTNCLSIIDFRSEFISTTIPRNVYIGALKTNTIPHTQEEKQHNSKFRFIIHT